MSRALVRSARQLRLKYACSVRSYSAPADGSIPESKKRFVPSELGPFPKGFLVGSSHAGVKPSNTTRDDITLITSESPCHANAMFTRNAFQAAPVQVSRAILQSSHHKNIRGVVINSGCANAVTGTKGIEDAVTMSKAADDLYPAPSTQDRTETALDVKNSSTLVMSTGVIGQTLPMDRILPAIPKAKQSAGSDHQHWLGVAKAIMTTDTFPKLVTKTFSLPSHPDTVYTISGITKGAGMIHPNMGTLLSVICTDCWAPESFWQGSVPQATNRSFNSITIDGDTSTNDTVLVLANGAAAPPDLTSQSADDKAALTSVLDSVMLDLAKLVVRDGEGATKFITINVSGATDGSIARVVARTIATSPLVKTAMYGKDANWGRILCAIGYSDAAIVPERVRVSLSGTGAAAGKELDLVIDGQPCSFTDDDVKPFLDEEDVDINVRLGDEDGHWTYYTCDLSHEYVTINADYRT